MTTTFPVRATQGIGLRRAADMAAGATMCLLAAAVATRAVAGDAASGGAGFPRWRGEHSNGSAGETSMPLIGSWDESRIAWVSEVKSPHPWNWSVVRAMSQWPRNNLGNGGYCMPAIVGGKVYVTYWRPAGSALATHGAPGDKWGRMWSESGLPALQLIEADQVFVCMDARTGATLWETAFEGKEMNHVEIYGGHNNLCVADGRVFGFGNAGWVYCVDAKTGAKVWSAPVGPSAKLWETFRARCVKDLLKSCDPIGLPPPQDEKPPEGGSLHGATYNMCPFVADGVLVAGEWSVRSELVGFDAATGRELWRLPGVTSAVVPPLLWRHGGKEYIIAAAGAITCVEPRTGRKLWSVAGALGNGGYDQCTVAIQGDYLVGPGPWQDQRDVPPEKKECWVCYRMSDKGAEKVWSLNEAYQSSSYISPVIHRGNAWLRFTRGKGMTGLTECDTRTGLSAMACVDVATGKVLGEVGGVPMNPVCPGPAAMGDRMFCQQATTVWMMDMDPRNPRFLKESPQPLNYCSSCSVADGFVYFRGAERLVVCLDARSPSHRPSPPPRHDDPANALYEMTLPAARFDGKDVRFCLRGREGKFRQTWAQTLAPGYHYPDVLEAEALTLNDGRLSGRAKAYVQAMQYDYVLDAEVGKDGSVRGTFQDQYQGTPVQGEISGTLRPPAGRNGNFKLSWDRGWCGGGAAGDDFQFYADLTDGVFHDMRFVPRSPPNYDVKIEKNEMAFGNSRWTGGLTLYQARMRKGHYVLTFNVGAKHNRLRGSVSVSQDGGPARDFHAWGEVTVPESEQRDPANGVYNLWLDKSVVGTPGMTVWFGSANGQISSEETRAWVRNLSGTHSSDPTGLRIDGDRLVGTYRAVVNGDGYAVKDKNIRCEYEVDARIQGGSVEGTFKGFFDKRDPRLGEIAGTWCNDASAAVSEGRER